MKSKKKKRYYIVLVMVPIIGHILNSICSHKNFYFNQYILFIMLIIQLFVLNKIDTENLAIEKELKNIGENNVRVSFNTKTKRLLHTTKGKIMSIILVLVYIVSMFKVGVFRVYYYGNLWRHLRCSSILCRNTGLF